MFGISDIFLKIFFKENDHFRTKILKIWQFVINHFVMLSVNLFLVADTQLYERLCPSVRWSVMIQLVMGKNVHFCPCPPVRNWYWPCIRPCFNVFARSSAFTYLFRYYSLQKTSDLLN